MNLKASSKSEKIYSKNDTLLTIAIPTYNRCSYLRELMPLLLGYVEKINVDGRMIEILVSDNDSNDATGEYIASLDWHQCLSYYRNEKNIGGDENFLMCIERSAGRYVWLFGDDDLISASGVEMVYDVLRGDYYDLVVAKDENYVCGLKASESFGSLKEFTDAMSLVNPHFLLAHTLITSNIFRKSIFNVELARGFIHTNYAHMYGLLLSLMGRSRKEGLIFVFNESVIKVRDVRAAFSEAPKNLLQKQKDYLDFIGNSLDNENIKKYAKNFYREEMIRRGINKIKSIMGKIPLFKRVFKMVKKLSWRA